MSGSHVVLSATIASAALTAGSACSLLAKEDTAAAQATIYKSMCAQKNKDELTGLGDVTCWYNDKHGELQVAKGTTFFSIELRKSGDSMEAIKAVGKKVYDRVK